MTDDLRKSFADTTADETWREKGMIFGQRKTHWDAGTLGRCDLEPSDHCCPHADMYVQEFRVLETVNNIRVGWAGNGQAPLPLSETDRRKVIARLRSQKTGTVKTIRTALGIKKEQEPFFRLNLDNDPDREINTDWFYREIVLPVFGEARWAGMSERERGAVNGAILRFDPDTASHASEFAAGASKWWRLPDDLVNRLIEAWRARPKLEKRARLSRRAIKNLLPLMRQSDPVTGCWPTVTEARQRFAEDPTSPATPEQRVRYAFNITDSLRETLRNLVGETRAKELLRCRGTSKRDRHYLKRHPGNLLPPAPMLANPVVRKAIHEVRRHVIAWLRKFGRKPDQIVIELISEARQSAKVRNLILARNRFRERIRKEIKKEHDLERLSFTQQEAAVDRVILLRQQRGLCAYTGKPIAEPHAIEGTDLEIDHIVPKSLSRDNGLNTKVLCHRNANRGKGQRTPKDWLSVEHYAAMLQHLGYLERDKPEKGSYFSKKDNARKWKNLTSETPDTSDFLASQYTDTAYAATQVREWLAGVLYGDENDPMSHVLPTNGRVTAALRRDWQLQDGHGPKDRSDHRHHALDALVIALSDLKLQGFLASLQSQEQFHAEHGQWSERTPVESPWGTAKEFHAQVFKKYHQVVVAHRPVKRRLVGEILKAKPLGKASEFPGLYTYRISASELAPNRLRLPKRRKNGTFGIPGSGKGGGQTSAIRSPALRRAIRQCLRANGLNPDAFTETDIKKLTDPSNYRLCFLRSGRPIYDITMVRTLTDARPIVGRDEVERYFIVGNNHHLEVVEDAKTKKWEFDCVDMLDATIRVKPPKRGPNRRPPQPMINRSDRDGKCFIMSLSEGETVLMKNPPRPKGSTRADEYDYFVVAKIDDDNVYVTHHTDSRTAKARRNPKTGLLEERRELIQLSASQLQQLVLQSGEPPKKVRPRLPAYKNAPESIQVLKND